MQTESEIIETFKAYASQDLVRLRAEEEQESYFDVYGEPDSAQEREELVRLIDLYGCWRIVTEVFIGGAWHHCDCVGCCAGYRNVLDPRENAYVIDIMRSAIEMIDASVCV